jgi:methionine sulfoxide reductase heme-binding subunit
VILAAASSATWYLTRASGIVALLLLTAALVLGVVDLERVSTPRWPRFLIDLLHRNVALLSICFLAIHIVTAALDSFAPIALLDAVVPFAGSYRPFWLGLGAAAFDLMLAIAATSLLRSRLSHRAWRAVHWLSWVSWPVALLHGLGTGSDTKATWMLLVYVLCLLAVLAAVGARLRSSWPASRDRARMALAAAGAFVLFLVVWTPSGPLGSGWARRSGTPASLLGHHRHSRAEGGR